MAGSFAKLRLVKGKLLLFLVLLLPPCVMAKTSGANGFDGIYLGIARHEFINQNGRMIRVPVKVVVYPDGKSVLVNLEKFNVHSVPVRGSFKGNVFTGIAEKTRGMLKITPRAQVQFAFSNDKTKVVVTAPDGSKDTFYREGTPQANAAKAQWPACLADIKNFDVSKHPYTYKAIDVSSAPSSALKDKSQALYGVFKVAGAGIFGDFTYLWPVNRNLQLRSMYSIKVVSGTLPLGAVKGSFIIVESTNPILVIPGTSMDYGEFYDSKKSREIEVIRQ